MSAVESFNSVGLFALIFAIVYVAMMLGLFRALRSGVEICTRDRHADCVQIRSGKMKLDPSAQKPEDGKA